MAEHNETGSWGEDYAAEYLQKNGYVIVERDWRFGHRDVDIIAVDEDDTTMVFVEVKTRTRSELVDPVEAVDLKKMRGIGYCANAYIKEHNIGQEIRFDVITVIRGEDKEIVLKHIEDAFNPCVL